MNLEKGKIEVVQEKTLKKNLTKNFSLHKKEYLQIGIMKNLI